MLRKSVQSKRIIAKRKKNREQKKNISQNINPKDHPNDSVLPFFGEKVVPWQ